MPSQHTVAMATRLIRIAAVFQVCDGIQVAALGSLRGAGDTRAPMLVALIGFTGLALPLSWFLGFRTTLGPEGLWWGLVVGLGVVAAILVVRVRVLLAVTPRRTRVEDAAAP